MFLPATSCYKKRNKEEKIRRIRRIRRIGAFDSYCGRSRGAEKSGEHMTTFEIACFVEMTQAAAAKVVRM